jgi:hypothetical protein
MSIYKFQLNRLSKFNKTFSSLALVSLTLIFAISQSSSIIYATTANDSRRSIKAGTEYYIKDDILVFCATQSTQSSGYSNDEVPTAIYETDRSLDNDARIWQFLTASEGLGLNDTAAAGLIGNMSVETGGGFDPNIIEGGAGVGYGILQWSYGRRTKVENYISAVQSSNPSVDLLDIQLSYLRKEITTTYKDTYSTLKAASKVTVKEGSKTTSFNDLIEVSTIISHGSSGVGKFTVIGLNANFIASGDDFSNIVPGRRYTEALKFYQKFTGSEGPGAANAPSSACPNDGELGQAGLYGWDLTGPNKMTYYIQEGQPWSDYPYPCGSEISDIGTCGCPVVTVASIISTLTTYKQNPQEIMEEWGHGFYSDYPTKSKYGLTKTTIKSGTGSTNWSQAVQTLKQGGLIMAHANRGTFTSNVHWFVIRKVSEDGNSFYIYDLRNPESENNNKAFTKQELLGPGAIDIIYGFTK